jgi:hypothetical protein
MWEKFTSGLGKVVQDLLNIFKKKNKTQEWDCVTFTTGEGTCDEIHLGPGKVTIMPLSDKQITWETPIYKIEDKELYERGKRAELPLFEDGISEEEFKELEKLFSIYLTDLPKRYLVKTLIVSCYASSDYDSIGADISQLEETGIAHYWCTSTKSMKEWDVDLQQRHILEEPLEIDTEEEHVIVNNAILEEWPNGYWTWRAEEE